MAVNRTSAPRLAVLVSGGGTNLQAMLDRSRSGALSAEIVVAASDRPGAYGLERAKQAGIPTCMVDYAAYLRGDMDHEEDGDFDLDALDRSQRILNTEDTGKRRTRLRRLILAERRLAGLIEAYRPDYICLAGFMRLVTPYFIQRFNQPGEWKILNIHPALLPAFPGSHGYEDTFAYGCKWGGVTVHFVDEGEDTGPILAQAVYPIFPGDDIDAVRSRGLNLEYEIYSQCINWLVQGAVEIKRNDAGRLVTVVDDPSYAETLKNWAMASFG